MIMKKLLLLAMLFSCSAQARELWWGGAVGGRMPYTQPMKPFDLASQNNNNQVAGLFVSNYGRYVWNDEPFVFGVYEQGVNFDPRQEPVEAGLTLRDTYLAACVAHFPPSGTLPDTLFFTAPWRVLSEDDPAIVRESAALHGRFAPYIMEYARAAVATGEPIVRNMEYVFPGEGFVECKDQFMLGDKYLVAPVVDDGDARTVQLPRGRWRYDLGKIHCGGCTITADAPLGRIPYFEKL